MGEFPEYIWALGSYGKWLLTGGPFLIENLVKRLKPSWTQWLDSKVPAKTRFRFELGIVLLALFVAGFLVWRDEHLAKLTSEQEGSKYAPRLTEYAQKLTNQDRIIAADRDKLDSLTKQLLSEADQRPWVHAPLFSITEPITHDANGIMITLQFTLRNSGRSPAQHVSVGLDTNIGPLRFDDAVKKACTIAETGHSGVTVFPDTPVPWGAGSSIPTKYIDEIQAQYKSMLKGSLGVLIIACVSYQFPSGGKFHHTPYALSLETINKETLTGCCTIPLDKNIIDPNSVRLRYLPTDMIGIAD